MTPDDRAARPGPNPPSPGLSVGLVIRTLNEADHLDRLFTGITNQDLTPSDVVVVDSGSTDDTVSIARRRRARIVRIHPSEFSFGRSLNRGCAALDTDLIVLVSAHTYPTHDTWLSELVAPFRDPDVVLSYGRQVGDHRTTYPEARLMRRWFPEESAPRQNHPFCNNANAAIRRSEWRKHPYDETLTGLEDLEFARRALANGGAISYVATAPVVHVHEESWTRLRNRYRREAIAHKQIYADQRLRAFEALSLALRNVSSDYASAARDRALFRNLLAIPRFHSAQFLGAFQGFSQVGDVTDQLKRRFYYPTPPLSEPPVPIVLGEPIDYLTIEDHPAHLRDT